MSTLEIARGRKNVVFSYDSKNGKPSSHFAWCGVAPRMINLMLTSCTEAPRPQASAHVPNELDVSLRARQAWISPKFLYDALGSKLFESICELPEYYPTRTEAGIFTRHGAEMARCIGTAIGTETTCAPTISFSCQPKPACSP